MFQSIPHADAVLLKCILHDWNDEQFIKILKNCKEAIEGKGITGKVIVIEMVTDVKNDDPELAELNMMVKYSGKKRSEKEWAELFSETDAILLKLVLHAYNDEDCIKVLKKCREAISSKGKEGKVIIIDIVINEKQDKHELTDAKLFYDVLMMSVVTGKEREEKEWESLFLEAGFSHYKITPIFGLRSLIEVYP
ncbi:hypothetical protein L6164_029706 [Bauhinia variegata]|uniref:Uncharacterized protein n=1 Tax=Bauhinia variegata TaxID=167791 RepID=A0ACB9LA23_BAUVA|nr:hypothetical protein L6164_029706 [Bauhinia variegata]